MIQLSLRWCLQKRTGLLQLKRWMLIWPGCICGVSCGILILSLQRIIHCVSLKRDITLHLPLSMATSPIEEVDVLKILGIYFNHKLTWSYVIDNLTTHCCQWLILSFVSEKYLGKSVFFTAYTVSPLLGLCVNMVMLLSQVCAGHGLCIPGFLELLLSVNISMRVCLCVCEAVND